MGSIEKKSGLTGSGLGRARAVVRASPCLDPPTGIHIAINVESIFEKKGHVRPRKEGEIPGLPSSESEISTIDSGSKSDGFIMEQPVMNDVKKERNWTADLVASSGGA